MWHHTCNCLAVTSKKNGNGWRAELATIIIGHVCLHTAMSGGRMSAPLLALDQGYSNAAAGVLVALFAFTQIFISLPAGRYADRHGLKRPLALCITSVVAGVGLAAIWPVYPVMCITALLTGGGIGSATIALQRHAGRMANTPAQVREVFSWLAIAPAVSSFVGPIVAGFMIDHGGFRAAFIALALMPLMGWALIRRVRELPNDTPPAGRRETAWDLLRDARMRHLLIMNWFMSASWDLHGFMVPVLGHERGLSASTIGIILGAFAIAAAMVRIVIPVLAPRLREWAMITAAIATTGTMFLFYPLTSSAIGMGMCSAGIGLALGVIQPTIMSMLHGITQRHRHGEALAVRMVMINVSSVSMPLMFGAVSAVIGATGLFWGMGAIVAGGSLLGLRLRDDRKEEEPPG